MSRLIAIALVGLILAGCFGNEEGAKPHELISPNDAALLMQEDPTILLVDLRTAEEYKGGYIQGAINVPLDELENLAKKKMPDKEQTIMIYCKTGKRSSLAATELLDLGYQHILEIKGGVSAWKGLLIKGEKPR